MATRRSRRVSSANQDAPAPKDDEFVSADQFMFELDKSVTRMTRSRRSSVSLSSAPMAKPSTKARRQTMLPAVKDTSPSLREQGRTSARGAKSVMAESPTKKFSKSTKNILTEEDILSKLDTSPILKSNVKETKTTKKVTSSKVVKPSAKSKIPIKSPPSASKSSVRRSRRVSGDPVSLKEEKKPVSKARRQTMLPAIAEAKSPAKNAPKSPVDVIKDVKKVEIRLKQLKLKEDPNLIFSLLEDSPDKKDRVTTVVQQIVNQKLEESPVTRNKQPKASKQSPKKAIKKETKTPKAKELKAGSQTPKAKELKAESKTPKRTTKTPKPLVKTPAEPKTKIKTERLTPKPETKQETEPKTAESSNKKRKLTATASSTPVQNKRLKLDKSGVKTPGSTSKVIKKQKTPSREVDKYKQRTPTPGSLRKPLKRLAGAKFTPAQVRPSDVLKRNMIRKVETEIVAKLSKRPDSSPYTLRAGENSPVFTKVMDSPGAVKSHITGTPVRVKPRQRKFGTTIQPCSLLEESTAPGTEVIKRVSSSTPMRPRLVTETGPHPLEAVEATPIRPPPPRDTPMSPPPEMVTGKLGSLCSIM